MIEYMLLFIGLIIIGIQGYLIAKIKYLEKHQKQTIKIDDLAELVGRSLQDIGGRITKIEHTIGVRQPILPRDEEPPINPEDRPSWMDKWNI